MKLFDIYPENFFSVLTSPNKKIYIEALFVIKQTYQHSAIIPKEIWWLD